MPTSVMTTNRISWILVLRLNISGSLPRADEHGGQRGGLVRVGGELAALRVLRGQDAVAQHLRDLLAEHAAELVGEVEVQDGVEVGVVADHELPADAEREGEGAGDPQRLGERR